MATQKKNNLSCMSCITKLNFAAIVVFILAYKFPLLMAALIAIPLMFFGEDPKPQPEEVEFHWVSDKDRVQIHIYEVDMGLLTPEDIELHSNKTRQTKKQVRLDTKVTRYEEVTYKRYNFYYTMGAYDDKEKILIDFMYMQRNRLMNRDVTVNMQLDRAYAARPLFIGILNADGTKSFHYHTYPKPN
jgi:hypothetical protein